MAIPLIDELAQETRRLAVAGSALAKDDYRVRKLIPGLEKLGEKAPVFKKVAETAERAISPDDKGRTILELATLLNAIQYTQGSIGCEGELEEIPSSVTEWRPTNASYRALSGVVEALTQTGSGRFNIIEDALTREVFGDARLMRPAVDALGDGYGEIVRLIEERVLPQFGKAALPLLLDGYDPNGHKINARKLGAICRIDPELGRTLSREALESGKKEMRLAAIQGLRGSTEDADLIMELTKDRAKDVKRAAVRALAGVRTKKVIDFVKGLLSGKLSGDAAYVAASTGDAELMDSVIAQARQALDAAVKSKGKDEDAIEAIAALLPGLEKQLDRADVRTLLVDLFKNRADLGDTVIAISTLLYRVGDPEIDAILIKSVHSENEHNGAAFAAAYRSLSPKKFHKLFGPMFERDALIVHIIQHGYYLVPFLDGGMFQLPKFELESAWVDTAIKDECVWLVERYAPEGHKKALKFLLSRDLQQYGDLDFHSAILRIDPKNGPELILDRILKTQNTAKPRWYGYYALNVIHKMPLSALPKIEAFGEKLKADYREYFDRILAEYRMNNAKP